MIWIRFKDIAIFIAYFKSTFFFHFISRKRKFCGLKKSVCGDTTKNVILQARLKNI